MRPRPAQTLLSLTRSYVTRPSRLAKPPSGFQSSSDTPLPSTSSRHVLERVLPASPASVFDALDQVPASRAPLLYSQAAGSSNVTLSSEQVQQLQAGRAQGQSISKLARRYGVSRAFVMRRGYPETAEGQLARERHEAVRQQAQQASRAKWGLNKWVSWEVRRAKRELW